jgi:hypothetical protein
MIIKKTIALICALPLLVLALPVSAQTDLTCSDITFHDDLTSRFPDIADDCLGVVESNGEPLAKFNVEIVRVINNNLTFRFRDPKDGSFGPRQRITVDSSWRARIDGNTYRARDLIRGQQLNIYLPADRWEAHVAEDTTSVIVVFSFVKMFDDHEEEVAMLPSTAGLMPLFALFGGMAIFSAFLIRVSRRR